MLTSLGYIRDPPGSGYAPPPLSAPAAAAAPLPPGTPHPLHPPRPTVSLRAPQCPVSLAPAVRRCPLQRRISPMRWNSEMLLPWWMQVVARDSPAQMGGLDPRHPRHYPASHVSCAEVVRKLCLSYAELCLSRAGVVLVSLVVRRTAGESYKLVVPTVGLMLSGQCV